SCWKPASIRRRRLGFIAGWVSIPSGAGASTRACSRASASRRASSAVEARYFETPAEFRAWLAANHSTATEIGVVFHKKGSGKPTMRWWYAFDQALCFVWIDSVARRIDDTSRVQRFTPRKPKSNWSTVNINKVAELTPRGLMSPAGLAAFARRTEARSGLYSYENRHLAALDPEREA